MFIYIDANIYLDYFKMSDETVISLKKLKDYLEKDKKNKLILPIQTKDEFFRNKNNIINQCLVTTNENIKKAVSLLSRHHEQIKIKASADKIKKELEKFNNELKEYLTDKNSEINNIIDSLFKLSSEKNDSDIIFNKAYKRLLKGNPPGKNNSIGDAIAWETLLEECLKEPLYVITKDKDWIDEVNEDELKLFLLLEWKKKSSKEIYLFKSIGEFLNKVTPKVKISDKVVDEERSTVHNLSYPYLLGNTQSCWDTLETNKSIVSYPYPPEESSYINISLKESPWVLQFPSDSEILSKRNKED